MKPPNRTHTVRPAGETGNAFPAASAADASERTSRNQDSRANETSLHETWDDDWKQPQLLDAPPPRPGFVQRWVATAIQGQDDAANVAKRFNQGWKPRAADSVPADFAVPTISHGRHAGFVGVEGMVLMERPLELHQRFAAKTRERTDNQMSAVNAALGEVHDPRQRSFGRPQMDNKSSVERGRIPVVSDED
jgi:hypothetical protein